MNDYARYGVREDNNIADAAYTAKDVDYSEGNVPLSDPDLVRVDRIRLLTDRDCPFYDLSYCWGTLRDGRHVRVDLGKSQFARSRGGQGKSIKQQLVECARAAGRHAHGLHML